MTCFLIELAYLNIEKKNNIGRVIHLTIVIKANNVKSIHCKLYNPVRE